MLDQHGGCNEAAVVVLPRDYVPWSTRIPAGATDQSLALDNWELPWPILEQDDCAHPPTVTHHLLMSENPNLELPTQRSS